MELGQRLRTDYELQHWRITRVGDPGEVPVTALELRRLERSDPLLHFMLCIRLIEVEKLLVDDFKGWKELHVLYQQGRNDNEGRLMLHRDPNFYHSWV